MNIPAGYQLKRYLVIGICALNILVCIIMAALSKVISDYIIDRSAVPLKPDEKHTAETIATVFIIVGSVLGILFQLLGLFGALKENVCLSITYFVLTAIGAFYDVFQCFRAPVYIPSTLLAVASSAIVLLFIIDLRKMRNGPTNTAQPYYA